MNEKQRDRRIAVRVSGEEKRVLHEYAIRYDVTASWVIRHAVKNFVAERMGGSAR